MGSIWRRFSLAAVVTSACLLHTAAHAASPDLGYRQHVERINRTGWLALNTGVGAGIDPGTFSLRLSGEYFLLNHVSTGLDGVFGVADKVTTTTLRPFGRLYLVIPSENEQIQRLTPFVQVALGGLALRRSSTTLGGTNRDETKYGVSSGFAAGADYYLNDFLAATAILESNVFPKMLDERLFFTGHVGAKFVF